MPDREREFDREPAERGCTKRELEELGSRIEYPATPDLARAVRLQLDESSEEQTTHRRRLRWPLPLSPRWAVAATALVLVVSLSLLSQDTRETLSGMLASGGASSEGAAGQAASGTSRGEDAAGEGATSSEVTEVTSSSAAQSYSAPDAASGSETGFGESLTLQQTRERLGGSVTLPRSPALPGKPDGIYALTESDGEGVAIVYQERPGLPPLGDTEMGLVLKEIPGNLLSAYPGAELGERPGVEEVSVGGGRGYWIPGERDLPPRLDRSVQPSANVLLWEQEGRVLRLETALPEEGALRIAESVR